MIGRWVGLVALAVGLAGCAAFTNAPPPRGAGPVRVVAAFYPLAYVAERVGGPDVAVTLLTHPGQEPHDLELSVAGMAAVARADVVLVEHGFQPAVDAAVDQNAGGTVIDAAQVVGLAAFGHAGHDHGHESDPTDPHFWQDPALVARLAASFAHSLAVLDPAHAGTYAANEAALARDLGQLDSAYRTGLAHCARTAVVVGHDAFGYLAKYGLQFWPISGLSPDAEPTAADLQQLQDLIRSDGVTTVFGEQLASPKLAQTLARDLGVRSEVLDPLEGLAAGASGSDYLTIMRSNLTKLREANQCR